MDKYSISNVPRFFEPYVNDCFQTALSGCLIHKGFNINLILTDYLSFLFDKETGYIGINYLHKYATSVEFTEEQLNSSLKFFYFPASTCYSSNKDLLKLNEDKINVIMYYEDDNNLAYNRLKELIKNGIPTVAAVDLFYMKYHRAFNKEHGLHNIVITGFDEEEGVFELFDKYKLSNSDFDGKLPISDVNLGRSSENPLFNSVMGNYTRPIRNLWTEVYVGNNFRIENHDLYSIMLESCIRMKSQKKVLGEKCGYEALDEFRAYLLQKQYTNLDEQSIMFFKLYYCDAFKVISRNRKRFKAFIKEIGNIFHDLPVSDVTAFLDESALRWDISANLSYKFGILKDVGIIRDIEKHLSISRDTEVKVVDILYDFVNKKIQEGVY
jgi:hypothetical protein